VNCGLCGEWAHFGCDRRQGLGTFKVNKMGCVDLTLAGNQLLDAIMCFTCRITLRQMVWNTSAPTVA
jgi:hypothetical protein